MGKEIQSVLDRCVANYTLGGGFESFEIYNLLNGNYKSAVISGIISLSFLIAGNVHKELLEKGINILERSFELTKNEVHQYNQLEKPEGLENLK